MMTAEQGVLVFLAVCVVGLGICLGVAFLVIGDLRRLLYKVERRVIALEYEKRQCKSSATSAPAPSSSSS
jgi:hypothetical protein